ncbi:PfaD family polyunsaturated fatty acid/polyketide biosynthesis protein [Actinocrispum sp. NPDC049592]|uniref:PfaD family polyunsaturated fatty acid/polyketide biosynthesis protein n=1 Tax=Actinocrispum sp. NPDC049592 TaxID=3154835 RepID=UPI00342C0CFE
MTLFATVHTDIEGIRHALARLDVPCYVVDTGHGIGVTTEEPASAIASVGPLPANRLGSSAFQARHGIAHSYLGGAMAAGIASEEMVIALARAGFLGSFGAAGLLPDRIERALRRFAAEIPELPFAANLIHSPSEQALERSTVDLYLRHGVRCVEASAFMDLTPHIVRYRVAGLRRAADGPVATNRVIAKVSRPEVAERFLLPAPEPIVTGLLSDGLVTAEQAALAREVPMADDITVEADSGGHTDRRPLVALFPVIARLRDKLRPGVGLGAAGGIGTPQAVAAAFTLGADYVVTGSVNQSCVEAGTSDLVRRLLWGAEIADCGMAPAADMFELGVDLQVLRRGTLFPMRARQLCELYRRYDGLDALPATEKDRLEQQILRQPLDKVWKQVVEYFLHRDPTQVQRASDDPKRRMALVFRWYLGMASRWATTGEPARVIDYQIWCGPAMGAFNDWARGTYLAENRRVADVAAHLMRGAAFTLRVQQLALAGVRIPVEYRP